MNSRDDTADDEEAVEALVSVAGWLHGAGADFLEVSGGNYESPALLGLERPADGNAPPAAAAPRGARRRTSPSAAAAVTRAVDVPVLLTGGFRTRAAMEGGPRGGTAALIGVGRPFALDPSLARKPPRR